jgi:K+ transporter
MMVSNTFKFVDGGFVPITIGIILFLMMRIWQRGRRLVRRVTAKINTITIREYLERLKTGESADYVHLYLINAEYRSLDEKIPMSLNDNVLEPGYGASTHFPSSIVFLYIKVSEDLPYVRDDRRFVAHRVTLDGFQPLPSINLSGCALPHHKQAVTRGKSNVFMVTIHYGYMETPDMVAELRTLQHRLGVGHAPQQWGRFVDRLTLDAGPDLNFLQFAEVLIFSRMRRWTSPIYDFYGLSRIGTVHGVRLLRSVHSEDMRPTPPVATAPAAASSPTS